MATQIHLQPANATEITTQAQHSQKYCDICMGKYKSLPWENGVCVKNISKEILHKSGMYMYT